jgi:hypothetical protein
MVAMSSKRVIHQTSNSNNERIWRETEMNVAYYAQHPERIDARLRELDEEWDVERVLETASATMTLGGLLLGVGVSRKWLLLSLAVQGFFMQHALQGWCPPLPVLRRLGVRTTEEIDQERYALKALRGDFRDVHEGEGRIGQAIEAVQS